VPYDQASGGFLYRERNAHLWVEVFFPGYGYIAVPHEYQNHYWRVGDYLPQWFWRYTVSQYWTYGLPQPPPGCAWIWLDGDVALVDMSDGYIVDMVTNIW